MCIFKYYLPEIPKGKKKQKKMDSCYISIEIFLREKYSKNIFRK